MNQPLFVSVGSRGLETADPVWVCAHETHTRNLTKVASSQPAYTAGYPHFRVLCVRVDCTNAHLHTEYMCIQVHVCLHTFFPHMLISFFFPFQVMVEPIREGEQSRPLPYLFRARGRRLLHWCSRGHPRRYDSAWAGKGMLIWNRPGMARSWQILFCSLMACGFSSVPWKTRLRAPREWAQ